MVKINFKRANSLSKLEVEEELRDYKTRGFAWKRYGFSGDHCQIWTLNIMHSEGVMVESSQLYDYFENEINELEFGNKEQL